MAFHTVESAREARRGRVNLVACGRTPAVNPGRIAPEAGAAAVEALRTAVAAAGTQLQSGMLTVTAMVNVTYDLD